MKRLVLFGASGFIGKYFQAANHPQLKVIAAPSGMLREPNTTSLIRFLGEQKPELILQFTGVTRLRDQGNEAFYEGNFLPTVRLASALQQLQAKHIPVYLLGSAAELGPVSEKPVSENTVCQPQSDYGRSKWFQTQFALAKNKDGFRFSLLRLFNVIGPGMAPEQVPACFLQQIAEGKHSLSTGPLGFMRDFIDVEDLVHALHTLVAKEWHGELLNICSGQGISPRELMTNFLSEKGLKVELKEDKPMHGSYHCVGDDHRLHELLGYRLPSPGVESLKRIWESYEKR